VTTVALYGGLYKSETLSLTNLTAMSRKTVTAPDSDRGTSVKVEIQNIKASSFNFCYPYGQGDNTDPYYCRE
jgi:hypothetical protein